MTPLLEARARKDAFDSLRGSAGEGDGLVSLNGRGDDGTEAAVGRQSVHAWWSLG